MISGMRTPPTRLSPYVRGLAAGLVPRSGELGAELAELIKATDIRYGAESVVPMADLVRSCQNNIEQILGTLAGAALPQTDGPRETGRRRAEQGMPLATTLRGYRIGGRFIWNVLLRSAEHTPAAHEALLQAAEVIWAIIDEYSEILSDAVRETIAEQVRRDTQMRTAVLDSVLDGSLGDGPAMWEAASTLGLSRRGVFVVVVAETKQPGDEPLPGVEQALRGRDVRSAWRLDSQRQTGVLAMGRKDAIVGARQLLAGRAKARIGVSEAFEGLEWAPLALRQARIACMAATPDRAKAVQYQQKSCAILLASAPDAGRVFGLAVLRPVLEQPAADRALLIQTLHTWFAEKGSTSAAASRLYVHRNTVRYRLRRIEELTGEDLSDPGASGRLLLALEAVDIFGLDRDPG